MSTPSKTAWDEEDNTPGKFSSWDVPTPGSKRREDDEDWSKRSSSRNRHYEKETPLPTPTFKKNSWMQNSRSSSSSSRSERPDSKRTPAVKSGEDKEDWEAEQKRLDREW